MMHLQRAFLMLALVLAALAFAYPLPFLQERRQAGELERTRYARMLQSCTPFYGSTRQDIGLIPRGCRDPYALADRAIVFEPLW
jgi:hypothetical protein